MIRALASLTITVALAVTLGAGPAVAGGGHPPVMLGPGDAQVHGIKDKALIRMSKYGFVYIAGQQNSHLTVTYGETDNTLRYVDTGTKRLGTIPKACTRQKAARGIAVTCTIPPKFRGTTMFVQVWVRLGHDFVNGAMDGDRVYGGKGNDLLRTGKGNDRLWGGPGKDRLSCAENYDIAYRDAHDSMYQCERAR